MCVLQFSFDPPLIEGSVRAKGEFAFSFTFYLLTLFSQAELEKKENQEPSKKVSLSSQ